ncbi:hypothetical protein [Leifsonia sp. Leaf264]|uniref:hypothetical protein n=1 Tax=Leifsonia sp. Leaf264 TaxID=1736314 RepID=UPI00070143F6|nr:hypothetical protein [Leifsonia sp. Leaf264]KQO97499.1 hypothetical protein ASF30_13795 [Leifsonia sp. Leaf264]
MVTSDFIALGALALALYAGIAGEVRAIRSRREQKERHLVDWEVHWTRAGEVQVISVGPDEARDVFVRLDINGGQVEGSAKCDVQGRCFVNRR